MGEKRVVVHGPLGWTRPGPIWPFTPATFPRAMCWIGLRWWRVGRWLRTGPTGRQRGSLRASSPAGGVPPPCDRDPTPLPPLPPMTIGELATTSGCPGWLGQWSIGGAG